MKNTAAIPTTVIIKLVIEPTITFFQISFSTPKIYQSFAFHYRYLAYLFEILCMIYQVHHQFCQDKHHFQKYYFAKKALKKKKKEFMKSMFIL